jgi:hypothetical protein
MDLSAQEKSFIEKRIKFARSWPIAGLIMILVLAILGLWLFWSRPLLINPWFVLSQLKAEAVSESTLILMAAILPVSMLMCIGLVIVFILLGFSVFSKERKYISIIHRLISEQAEKSALQ